MTSKPIIQEKKEEFLNWLRKRGLEVKLDFPEEYGVRSKELGLCVGVLFKRGLRESGWHYGVYEPAENLSKQDERIKSLLDEIEANTPYSNPAVR